MQSNSCRLLNWFCRTFEWDNLFEQWKGVGSSRGCEAPSPVTSCDHVDHRHTNFDLAATRIHPPWRSHQKRRTRAGSAPTTTTKLQLFKKHESSMNLQLAHENAGLSLRESSTCSMSARLLTLKNPLRSSLGPLSCSSIKTWVNTDCYGSAILMWNVIERSTPNGIFGDQRTRNHLRGCDNGYS